MQDTSPSVSALCPVQCTQLNDHHLRRRRLRLRVKVKTLSRLRSGSPFVIFCLNQLGFRQMTEYAKGGGELSAFKSMKQKIKQTDQTDIFQSMKFCFYFPTVCYSCHGILTYILDCAVYTLQLCCR